MVLHTRASGQRHREHLRLPSPVQVVAGHAASAKCTALHVKKKAQVRPKEDTTSVFFKPFWAETIKLNPNRLLKPVHIWLACWACCLSYSWGNSGTALRKQGSRDADKQTKDEQEALLFFLPLACTWNKLYVCNRVSVKQHCFWQIVDRKMLNVRSMASTNPYADKKERFR